LREEKGGTHKKKKKKKKKQINIPGTHDSGVYNIPAGGLPIVS